MAIYFCPLIFCFMLLYFLFLRWPCILFLEQKSGDGHKQINYQCQNSLFDFLFLPFFSFSTGILHLFQCLTDSLKKHFKKPWDIFEYDLYDFVSSVIFSLFYIRYTGILLGKKCINLLGKLGGTVCTEARL